MAFNLRNAALAALVLLFLAGTATAQTYSADPIIPIQDGVYSGDAQIFSTVFEGQDGNWVPYWGGHRYPSYRTVKTQPGFPYFDFQKINTTNYVQDGERVPDGGDHALPGEKSSISLCVSNLPNYYVCGSTFDGSNWFITVQQDEEGNSQLVADLIESADAQLSSLGQTPDYPVVMRFIYSLVEEDEEADETA